MTSGLKSESGWTLIELLVAMTLMLIVLSATLTSFNLFLNTSRANNRQNDQQEVARVAIDQVVRQLRNLANPTGTVATIAYADRFKIVFQTTDPAKQWVLYCLDNSTPSNETLWYEATASSATLTASQMSGCRNDDPVWTTKRQVVTNVTNERTAPPDRPVFTYAGSNGPITPPATGSITNTATITRVSVDLFIDADPTKPPAELEISSGAYMRNQNQVPTASMEAQPSGTGFLLDGGSSSDPEGRTLQFYWFAEQGAPTSAQTPDNLTASQTPTNTAGLSGMPGLCSGASGWSNFAQIGGLTWTCIGTGVLTSYSFPTGTSPQNIWLLVVDPGGLPDLSDQPAGYANCPVSTARTYKTTCEQVQF